MLRILVVDDDPTLRMTVRAALETRGYHIEEAADGLEAVEMCRSNGPYDAVLLDVNMPNMSGLEALTRIKEMNPKTFCLILTAYSKVQDAVSAIKNGAYDYLEKPVEAERILKVIDSALEAHSMVEVAAFSAPHLQFDEGRDMIGESTSIRKVFDLIYKLSKVETSVLIRGESGTGKELVAQALHFNSHRKKGPFVAVNCGAIPENLIESELFGHEKGAFTGADKRKIGKFQFAAGGTIFLDEIGDISFQMQVKLLRGLQEKRFTPVGSNQELTTDVRVISATNKNLEEMIKKSRFRADLFYRLNVLPIHLPALRERREDIDSLTEFMIKKFNHLHSRQMEGISTEALQALQNYSWPGNIRELENVIEHAFIIEAGGRIGLDALPDHIREAAGLAPAIPADMAQGNGSGLAQQDRAREMALKALEERQGKEDSGILSDFSDLKYPILKERFEKEFIQRALKAFNGRINQTAENTQMTKVTLLRKLEKYNINPKEFRK